MPYPGQTNRSRILVPVTIVALLGAGWAGIRARVDPDLATPPGFDYSAVDYDVDPGPSALSGDRSAPEFPPPVIDPELIIPGGVAPDAITPIDDPTFMALPDVRFIQPSEAVIVVRAGDGDRDEVKAYPIRIMIWHEIVNDMIGGAPVSVTYCPLCNSAVAFRRVIGERVLDFGTSGELYQSALVMYDRQTESLWAHFTGRGLVGHYAGAELTVVPARTMSFQQLRHEYPDAMVMTPDTGADRDYGVNPYPGYEDGDTGPIEAFSEAGVDDRLEPMTRVVGVIPPGGGPVAVVMAEPPAAAAVVVSGTDGEQVVVFHRPGLASALERAAVFSGRDVGQSAVYRSPAGGRNWSFTATDDGFVDDGTRSTWTIGGEAVAGPLAGSRLAPLPHLNTFWFAWSAYYPDTVIVEG